MDAADAVVVMIGVDISQGHEGIDRRGLTLAGQQPQLLNETLTAAGGTKPVVIIVQVQSTSVYTSCCAMGGINSIGLCVFDRRYAGTGANVVSLWSCAHKDKKNTLTGRL